MAFDTFNLAEIYGAADRANAQRDAQQYQQYQIQRQMRDDQRQDAVRGAYKIGPDGQLDRQGTYASLYAVDPMAALDLQGKLTAQDAASAKAKGESTKLALDNKTATAKYLRDAGAGVSDQATYDAWKQEAQALGAQFVSSLPAQYDPNVVRQQLLTADKFIDQSTPKPERVDIGGKIQVIDMNPFTNPSIKGTQFDKTLTPGEILTDDRTRSEGKLNRGVAIRGQDMTNERAKTANELKAEENSIKRSEKLPENSTTIRKEFDQLPEVKNYKQALPAYTAIEDAAKRNTTAADINIVYGLAKLYDPNSVVREGEYATVANSPNIPEKLKGQIQYITGGGRLTPETKKQILAEARGRMSSFENEYSKSRTNYTDIAKRSNADPSLVFPDEYKSVIKKDENKQAPKIGTVVDGYVFKGGNPADKNNWKLQ